MYEIITYVSDPALARVLIVALQAHGFHPLESGENGLPGLPGVVAPRGIPIRFPDEEAVEGKLLAEDRRKDRRKR